MISGKRTACSALLLLLCLSVALTGQAASLQVKPLPKDDNSSYYQAYYIKGPGALLTLPLSTQVELYHQEAGLEILLLDLTDDPSDDHHLLAFFAIRHEAASKDLSAYSDNQLPQALSSISSQRISRSPAWGRSARGSASSWAWRSGRACFPSTWWPFVMAGCTT